jgi:hypothetical protein
MKPWLCYFRKIFSAAIASGLEMAIVTVLRDGHSNEQ